MSAQRRPSNTASDPGDSTRHGHCPTCGQQTSFSFNGQQHWPAHIAATIGVAAVVNLWNCDHCHTTISEQSLDEANG